MENVMKKRKRTANMKRGKLKGALLRANWIASLFVKVIYLNEINWILNDPFNECVIIKIEKQMKLNRVWKVVWETNGYKLRMDI